MKTVAYFKKDSYVSQKVRTYFSGIVLLFLIALFANSVGKDYPTIGGAVIALTVGISTRAFLIIPPYFQHGIDFTVSKLLKLAIVLLGFGLTFDHLAKLGDTALALILICVVLGLLFTFAIAKAFRLTGRIPVLVAVGTAICGATAIIATSPIIRARTEETTYAINTIFAFNVLAVLIYPLIGHFLGMSDAFFGTWAGIAIHDTSSVVTAGYIYGQEAGDISVIVKLTRTLMLIPLALVLSLYTRAHEKQENSQNRLNRVHWVSIFPFFILFFALAVGVNTAFPLSLAAVNLLGGTAKFLIVMVMAGVGLKTDFRKIREIGLKPIWVGLLSSVSVGALSAGLIYWWL